MTTKSTAGYELFLPVIAAAVRTKEKKGEQESDKDIRQITQVAFHDAMQEFCKDSELYQTELPIDYYELTTTYDLVVPDKFRIVKALFAADGELSARGVILDNKTVTLPKACCPQYDVHQAIWVKVAVTPSRTNLSCQFDAEFLDENYDVIRDLMFHYFYMMKARPWEDLGRADRYRRNYRKGLAQARRNALGIRGKVRFKQGRISDDS